MVFTAPWCGSCPPFKNAVQAFLTAERYKDVKLTIYNVDEPEGQELANGFGVMSLPTMIILDNGNPIGEMRGQFDAHQLEDIL